MRGKITALVCLSLLMLSVGEIPRLLLGSLPAVEYVRPQEKVLERELTCVGVIYAEKESELYLDSPVIASEVLVTVGDRVEENELLARVNTQQTKRILEESTKLNLPTPPGTEEELARSISSGALTGVDLGELLETYQSTFGASVQREPVYLTPEITSPISGVVTKVNLRPNFLTQLAEPAFVISDLSTCKVLASLPQSEMDKVHVGDGATITGSGMEGKSFQGVVSKIYPTAKRVYSGTVQEAMVELEITLLETSQLQRPGYSVTVKIHDSKAAPAVLLPYEAVDQDENNVEYVYLLTPDLQIRRQDVTTGKEVADGVEIVNGVDPRDMVIVHPGQVKEGNFAVYVKGEAAIG